jgi:hypothetical protein
MLRLKNGVVREKARSSDGMGRKVLMVTTEDSGGEGGILQRRIQIPNETG